MYNNKIENHCHRADLYMHYQTVLQTNDETT